MEKHFTLTVHHIPPVKPAKSDIPSLPLAPQISITPEMVYFYEPFHTPVVLNTLRESPNTTYLSTEQLSPTTSSLPANVSTTFPHPISPQPPQVITQPTSPCNMSHKAFQAFITTLLTSEQFFLGCYTFPPSIQHFVSTIHNKKFIMALDGSVQAPNGSFAWVIYGANSETHWSGYNTIAKGHLNLTSVCIEACGYLGALYALCTFL